MKILSYPFILMAALFLTFGFTACEKQGPAEKAGEEIDQAVEEAGENLSDAKEEVQDMVEPEGPMEKAGEKMDEAVEQSKEMVEESVE